MSACVTATTHRTTHDVKRIFCHMSKDLLQVVFDAAQQEKAIKHTCPPNGANTKSTKTPSWSATHLHSTKPTSRAPQGIIGHGTHLVPEPLISCANHQVAFEPGFKWQHNSPCIYFTTVVPSRWRWGKRNFASTPSEHEGPRATYMQHWPQFVLPGTLTKELIASLAGEFKTRSWRPEISVYCDRKQRRFEVGSKTGALTRGYERQGRVQDSACRNPSCWGLFSFACVGCNPASRTSVVQ